MVCNSQILTMNSGSLPLILLLAILPFAHAVNWNGNNWALACDFRGGDFTNAQVNSVLPTTHNGDWFIKQDHSQT